MTALNRILTLFWTLLRSNNKNLSDHCETHCVFIPKPTRRPWWDAEDQDDSDQRVPSWMRVRPGTGFDTEQLFLDSADPERTGVRYYRSLGHVDFSATPVEEAGSEKQASPSGGASCRARGSQTRVCAGCPRCLPASSRPLWTDSLIHIVY